MKYPNDKREFDLSLVFGLGLIALAPTLFVVLSYLPRVVSGKQKEPISQWETSASHQPTMQQSPVVSLKVNPKDTSPLPPALTSSLVPTPRTTKIYNTLPPVLSPNGLYAATLEGVIYQAPGAAASVSSPRELIILRVSDRKELLRHPIDGEALGEIQWSRDGFSLATADRFGQVWNRVLQKKPEPTAEPTTDSSEDSSASSDGRLFESDGAANRTYINLESDAVVQLLIGGGIKAYRASTGKPIPLRFDWHPASSLPKMALLPISKGRGAQTLRAILSDELATPAQTPKPTPTPTPMPTPEPLSLAQQEYLKKETRIAEEVGEIVAKLDGEKELSDFDRKALELRAKSLNEQMRAGRRKFFPNPKVMVHISIGQEPDFFARVELRDLSTGTLKWRRRMRSNFFPPTPLLAPDGSKLLLVGCPRRDKNVSHSDRGIEILNTRTGRTLYSLELGFFGSTNEDNFHFLSTPQPGVAFIDSDARGNYLLRTIDLNTGRSRSAWSFNALKPLGIVALERFSCDATGQKWAFRTQDGWKVFSRVQLEKQSKIPLVPTPLVPTPSP